MLLALPALTTLLFWLYWYKRSADARLAFLYTALSLGVAVFLSTELLSLLNAFSRNGIALAWLICAFSGGVLLWRERSRAFPFIRMHLPLDGWLMLLLTGICVIVVGVVALVAAPNNWDSQTYHLPRAMHWLQNNDVNFYFTHITRQNYQHPWAEYAIAHTIALTGDDWFANSVQWWALVGTCIVASLIARALGTRWRGDARCGQALAALLVATLPMAILQGSSTQNDLVTAFWVSAFAYFVVLNSQVDQDTPANESISSAVGAGVSLGLAIATKATAYLYCFPFVLWFAIVVGKRLFTGRSIRQVHHLAVEFVIIGGFVGVLALPHLLRNMSYYGSPTGPEGDAYTNEAMSPVLFLSNVVRNIRAEIAVPTWLENRYYFSYNADQTVLRMHEQMGVDALDPRTTLGFVGEFRFPPWQTHEDGTAAPLHLLAIVGALPLFFLRSYRQPGTGRSFVYLSAGLVACLLFVLILKMQPWHNRLHTSLFILLLPFAGVVIAQAWQNWLWRLLILGGAGIMFYFALPMLFTNQSRPWQGERTIWNTDRWTQRFVNQPILQAAYANVISELARLNCDQVGFQLTGLVDTWEYSLWVRARDSNLSLRLEHISTQAQSSAMPALFQPCAIVSDGNIGDRLIYQDVTYSAAWSEAPLLLYVPLEGGGE